MARRVSMPAADDRFRPTADPEQPAPEQRPRRVRAVADDAEAPAEEPAAKQPARAAKGRGRASVPSWDEIMFGTPKDS